MVPLNARIGHSVVMCLVNRLGLVARIICFRFMESPFEKHVPTHTMACPDRFSVTQASLWSSNVYLFYSF